MQKIIEKKFCLNEFLIEAIVKDDAEMVKDLLERGADPNGFIDNDKLTPLFFAASYNAIQSAFLLLSKGANPNFFCTGPEMTPIQLAKFYDYYAMARLLRGDISVQLNTHH